LSQCLTTALPKTKSVYSNASQPTAATLERDAPKGHTIQWTKQKIRDVPTGIDAAAKGREDHLKGLDCCVNGVSNLELEQRRSTGTS